MKNQTIKIDFTAMLYIGIMYTGLVISGWLLMRLTIACFKLPSILNAAAAAAELKERTSTTGIFSFCDSHDLSATNMLSKEENEDMSSVQYFDTSTQDTCNDTNILQQSEGEKRGRKRNTGSRTNAINATYAEAELITKGLNNTDDVDGRRTTRSSTRGSTAASKLKNEPPAKKEKKTPAVKGKRGRPKAVSKEESEDVVSAEENGIADNDVDSKADKGGSSTEEEVDSKTEDKIENGNSSAEEEKKVEEKKESTDESDKPAVTEAKKDSSSP